MAFNNYLEDENDKPYFTKNSLAYYYDKMEGFAKAVEGSAKALNLTKEEIEQRIALRLAEWDGKLEGFDSSVETLLTEWVEDGTLTHVIDSTLIDQKVAPLALQLTNKVAKKELTLNVKDFGAVGDGVTDDTESFNLALAYHAKTSPQGFSGWGIGEIYIPKGKYLINGTITRNSSIGVVFRGESEYATSLFRTIDTGAMFKFPLYISLGFEKMSIHHIPVGGRETWSTSLFELDGFGGGRNFSLKNVTTVNFNIIIKHLNIINEDTNYVDSCTFNHCKTFLDSINAQAVDNTYSNCTWSGDIDQVFHVAGQQHTLISSGNVVCNGPLIKYKDIVGKYNDSGFTLLNVKFEWMTIHQQAVSPPKIIDAAGSNVCARITMIDCGLRGGPTPHPNARFAKFGSGAVFVDIQGGEFEGLLEVVKLVNYQVDRGHYIKFTGCRLSDPSTWLFTDTGVSGSIFPPISIKDCRIAGRNLTNITLSKSSGVPYVDPRRIVVLGKPKQAVPNYGDEIALIDYPSFGQPILINSIKLNVRLANNIPGRKIQVYSDKQRVNLIGEFSIPDGSLANKVYDIPIVNNTISTDGLFFTVISTGYTLNAVIIADFTSI